MIQTSGISLRTTQKQVREDTKDFAEFKKGDDIVCSKKI